MDDITIKDWITYAIIVVIPIIYWLRTKFNLLRKQDVHIDRSTNIETLENTGTANISSDVDNTVHESDNVTNNLSIEIEAINQEISGSGASGSAINITQEKEDKDNE